VFSLVTCGKSYDKDHHQRQQKVAWDRRFSLAPRAFLNLKSSVRLTMATICGKLIAKADVVIDFSSHERHAGVAELCAKNKKAIVIGTTGHSDGKSENCNRAQIANPDGLASNFSTGVNTLFWLTRKAAEILGPNFDLEVVEMHHRLKKDAPSGTATTLAEILGGVRKLQLRPKSLRHGRKGIVGERTAKRDWHPRDSRRRCRGRSHGHFRQQRRAR
jgi:4-hydroxy-tetrahydrodipicolinate reductase